MDHIWCAAVKGWFGEAHAKFILHLEYIVNSIDWQIIVLSTVPIGRLLHHRQDQLAECCFVPVPIGKVLHR